MPLVHLEPGEEVSFDPAVLRVVVIADSRQDHGSCSVDFTNGQTFPFIVNHSGIATENCIIRHLRDPEGNVVGLIETVANDGSYDITVRYS